MEFVLEYASALAHPLVSAALGFLAGGLAGFRLGLWRHRGDRLNDALRAARGLVAEQLDIGPRSDTRWLSSAQRDHLVTELPAWRRRHFCAAWEHYKAVHAQERHQFSGIFLLRDPAPVAHALRDLHRALRPV